MGALPNGQSVTLPETVTSAQTLHSVMKKSFVLGNNVKRKFIMALREMKVTKGYTALDFSSIDQYAHRHYKFAPSTTYEYIRVADALLNLPLCDEAYRTGEINYSILRQLVK